MKENKICLNCIRWEGRHSFNVKQARCSQINKNTEQTDFCIFWIKAFPQLNTVID